MLTLVCPTGQTIVARQLEDGTLLRNYTRVLEIILRLRQICDAAALCPHPPPDPAEATATVEKATPELLARLAAVLEVNLLKRKPYSFLNAELRWFSSASYTRRQAPGNTAATLHGMRCSAARVTPNMTATLSEHLCNDCAVAWAWPGRAITDRDSLYRPAATRSVRCASTSCSSR